jgi:tetratricopeptide (TPR) repeat protein
MKSLFLGLVLVLMASLSPSWAEAPASDCPPWVKAQAVWDAALPDLKAGGIRALSSHVDDFEQALANMDKSCETPKEADFVVLTDGMMETMIALAAAGKNFAGKKVVAIHDPYPMIALYLASYYNETRHYADALRVLERERSVNKGTLGDTRAALTSERAVALGQLRRLDEALAVYEEGLKLDNINDKGKARMHRGRGFVLTELDRLDEAAAAYEESLKLEPGNYVATHELEYIMKLKMGGNKAPASAPVLPGNLPKTN